MKNTKLLMNIIDNLKNDKFSDAIEDCLLLPKNSGNKIINALKRSKNEAVATADRLLGNI
jgi:hypothetical protein